MDSKTSHIKIKDFLRNKKILIGILIVGIVLIGGWRGWNSFHKCSVAHPEFCDRSCEIDEDCYPSCLRDCGCINALESCRVDIRCEVPPFSCKCVNNVCEIAEFGEKDIAKEQFCSKKTLEECDGKRVCLIGVVNFEPAGKNYGYEMSDGVEWNNNIINSVIINSSRHNLKIPLGRKIEVKGIVRASAEVKDDGLQHLLGFENRLYDPTVIEVEEIRELQEEEIKIPEEQIIITTDKPEYEQGEIVKMIINNNLNQNIYYYENIYCYLEYKKENEIWILSRAVNMPCLRGEVKEIKNNEVVYFSIDFDEDGFTHYFGGGKYRIAFNYGTDKNITSSGIIYSNEFTIKE